MKMDKDPPNTHMDTQEDTHLAHSTSSIKEQIESMLQDPQQCRTILELCLECTDVIVTLPPMVQD
jgi:hypothetical protein